MKAKQLVENKHRLIHYLSDGNWHKSKTIPMPHRTIRHVCEHYSDTFISTQKGYCLLRCASAEDISLAINDLRSRAKKMQDRANAIELAQHDLRHQPQALPF